MVKPQRLVLTNQDSLAFASSVAFASASAAIDALSAITGESIFPLPSTAKYLAFPGLVGSCQA